MDALYHGIAESQERSLDISSWVERMADNLRVIREVAALEGAKSVEARQKQYDKGTRLRQFAPGDKVWYRIPGLHDKLSESWEGPYEVVARNRDIVYRIRKEGKKNGGKSIHINNLRRYDERKDFNRLDVVIEGEDDNDEENADREGGRGGGKNGRVNLSGECEGFDAAQ